MLLVHLHLSPGLTNHAAYTRLCKGAEAESKRGDGEDDPDFVTDDIAEDETLHIADKARAFSLKYIYEQQRYPEEDRAIRERIAGLLVNCPLPECKIIRKSGGACEHTFPSFFKPNVERCASCGACA